MGRGLGSALHSPDLLWEDDSPQGQREAEPAPASTGDVFRMHLYFRQETPLANSREQSWMQQPEQSSEKVKAHLSPMELKPQLPGLGKAARESPSPSLPWRVATALAEAVTSKFIMLANRLSTQEQRGMSPPAMVQVEVQSQTQPQAVSFPHPEWGTSFIQPIPNSAQPLQAEDPYKPDLGTGFFPSWTEAFEVKDLTAVEAQQARGVTPQGKTCKPKTDIVFLKVHKSASSTVMNILFRFGETHNLTFAFPRGGGFQLFYPYHFLARFVHGFSPRSPRRFNILCHHMRFLQPEVGTGPGPAGKGDRGSGDTGRGTWRACKLCRDELKRGRIAHGYLACCWHLLRTSVSRSDEALQRAKVGDSICSSQQLSSL